MGTIAPTGDSAPPGKIGASGSVTGKVDLSAETTADDAESLIEALGEGDGKQSGGKIDEATRAAMAAAAAKDFKEGEQNSFKEGDLVEGHPLLSPHDEPWPASVIEKINPPKYSDTGERLDVVILVVDKEGKGKRLLADSRTLQPYSPI